MSTMVFDPATLTGALTVLNDEINDSPSWLSTPGESGPQQQRLLDYWQFSQGYNPQIDLQSFAVSTDHNELNTFLTERGFTPAFRQISRGGIGVATVLDLLMEWAAEAKAAEIYRKADGTSYRAFQLPVSGVQIMDVEGVSKPVVRIPTKNGLWAWLAMTDQPVDELEMLDRATGLLNAKANSNNAYAGACIPTLEIDQQVDLSWLLGLRKGGHIIDQAFQQVKLRMNEIGARVKAATGVASTRSVAPQPLVFNQPFLGFFTRGSDSPLPIGIFYAGTGSWREPAGSLEEL